MKNFIVGLMFLSALASCGKNNSVATTSGVTVNNPIVTNSVFAQTLVANINNPSTGFGQGMILSSNSNQKCGTTFFGLLPYCTYGGTASQTGITWNSLLTTTPSVTYQYSSGRTVRNSDITIASKQSQLLSILNSATNVQSNGQIAYVTVSGAQYVIDTRLPIQANPASTYNQSGSEYFVQAF